MNRSNQPWRALQPATLEWDAQGAPFSTQFDDVYYARRDGPAESRYVFLQGNRLSERLAEPGLARFCILETGFGTGLNFLETWQAWRSLPEPRPSVHYVSVEKFPLRPEDLATALQAQVHVAALSTELMAAYPPMIPGQHRRLFNAGRFTLDLWFEDAEEMLTDLAASSPASVDAFYLDGFAPARNPDMWRPEIYAALAGLGKPGATIATFSAAGHVRRGLANAGFSMLRAPGFGTKRECLRGTLERPPAPSRPKTPWDIISEPRSTPDSALVVGGGLAGCATAARLAQRGLDVTLLDAGDIAGGGSGNAQGVLYTRVSHRHSALTDFALQSYLFAIDLYAQYFRSGRLQEGVDGLLCGNFQQMGDTAKLARLQEALDGLPNLAAVLSPPEASERVGVPQPDPGLWFPGSGWLHPPALCRLWLENPRIEVKEHCGRIHLEHADGRWSARGDDGVVASADCAILATGAAMQQDPLGWLPLQSIRGQTTDLPSTAALTGLKACLCHDGYLAPARRGLHTLGATFNLDTDVSQIRVADHQENLDRLEKALPSCAAVVASAKPEALEGRVAFRCASSDYLPVIGPVPERERFLQTFEGLRKNARLDIRHTGPYMPGLYINVAHGSRGLTSTPLAAELLAALICHEPLPLCRDLYRAVAPGRFLIRDLVRGEAR
ncbi:MAG: bifunctional tRNA (5-methylaminomethyl-2-thiouridine)(34)-methyltransferase MnmD/FAD-dependent 5-carboxymethylaminomethyl-2-thiouridine(34) oxidoreductase MnmC [Pseudomonadota bacterium]